MYSVYVYVCVNACRSALFILVSSCALAVLLMPGMYMSHELSCSSIICFQERRVQVGVAAMCSSIFSNCFPAHAAHTKTKRSDGEFDTIQYSRSAMPLLFSTVFMAKLASVSEMLSLRMGPSRPGAATQPPPPRTTDDDGKGENEPLDDDDDGMVAEEYAAMRRHVADRLRCG